MALSSIQQVIATLVLEAQLLASREGLSFRDRRRLDRLQALFIEIRLVEAMK